MSYNPFFTLKAENSNIASFSSTTDETYILLIANDVNHNDKLNYNHKHIPKYTDAHIYNGKHSIKYTDKHNDNCHEPSHNNTNKDKHKCN